MKNEKYVQEFAKILGATEAGRAASIERFVDGARFVRRFVPEDRLILLGGGHIAVPLCAIASMLDFSVTVVDDRPSFANMTRFPSASRVVCDSFPEAIRGLGVRPTDYICVITRGHRWDADCLRAILPDCAPSYLGMIGSRRRVTALLKSLEEEGFDPERLASIHTPIGLRIRAETPAEIAVSICGEMIQHRRSRSAEEDKDALQRTDTNFDLLRFVAEDDSPGALMTVISTFGSTPVESGAIMAMDSALRIFGSVGGGCGESEVMLAARRLIGTGRSAVIDVDMTNDIAEEEGMVCGGRMRVLIEDISA